MLKVNKTAMYLAVFLLYYDKEFINLLSKLVKTRYYAHNEMEEENFGKEIYIQCPIATNSTGIFTRLDSNKYVNKIFRRGSDKIVAVKFIYPTIFKSIVTGKYSLLKNSPFFMEKINDQRLKHLKAIFLKEDFAIKRYKRIVYEELQAEAVVLSETELELPFRYDTESMFYTCKEKYLMTNLYEEQY